MADLSLLLVDDDDVFRERLARGFVERGFEVRTARDVPSALALAQESPPELAVVDLRMPGCSAPGPLGPGPSGLALVAALIALDPATRVVVLTGWGSVATAVEAMKHGAAHYLQKPVGIDELVRALVEEERPTPPTADVGDPLEGLADIPSLARQEWEYIHRVLGECEANISAAARRLGLHRRSLQRKLQKQPPPR